MDICGLALAQHSCSCHFEVLEDFLKDSLLALGSTNQRYGSEEGPCQRRSVLVSGRRGAHRSFLKEGKGNQKLGLKGKEKEHGRRRKGF